MTASEAAFGLVLAHVALDRARASAIGKAFFAVAVLIAVLRPLARRAGRARRRARSAPDELPPPPAGDADRPAPRGRAPARRSPTSRRRAAASRRAWAATFLRHPAEPRRPRPRDRRRRGPGSGAGRRPAPSSSGSAPSASGASPPPSRAASRPSRSRLRSAWRSARCRSSSPRRAGPRSRPGARAPPRRSSPPARRSTRAGVGPIRPRFAPAATVPGPDRGMVVVAGHPCALVGLPLVADPGSCRRASKACSSRACRSTPSPGSPPRADGPDPRRQPGLPRSIGFPCDVGFGREARSMPRRRPKPEEVVAKLSIGAAEVPCRRRRNEFGGRRQDQVRRPKELEHEDARRRRAVSDLALDERIPSGAMRAGARWPRSARLSAARCAGDARRRGPACGRHRRAGHHRWSLRPRPDHRAAAARRAGL